MLQATLEELQREVGARVADVQYDVHSVPRCSCRHTDVILPNQNKTMDHFEPNSENRTAVMGLSRCQG